jgi:hypothetical protein
MKKKTLWSSNERVDVPDATAIHDLADETRRGDARGVLSQTSEGPAIIRGFTCRVNPADDTQILITPGVALMRELLADGTVEEGQLVNLEGEDDEILDLSGRPTPSEFGIWVRFLYRAGETRNRARWRPDLSPEREQVVLMETRQIAGLSVRAETDSPGGEWFQIASVHWDGGLVAGDLIDARTLYFEGEPSGSGNPASSWSTADFSRSADRSTNGVKSLRQLVTAVQRRLLELAGRPKWYTAPVWGENVRSAGAAVTVRPVDHDGDEQTAHLTLGTAAQNRVTLTLMMLAGNLNHRTAGDPRSDVCFLPKVDGPSVIEVDCSADGVTPSGDNFRRRFYGAADLRRTAGNNDLIVTPAAAAAHGFVASFDGLTFSATDGTGALLRVRHAADDLVFTNCTFDGTGTAETTALVRIEAPSGARVSFVNCRFLLRAGQTGVLISGAADVRFLGGSFTGAGDRCVNITASPAGIFSAVGTRFEGATTILKAVSASGISLGGCQFAPGTTLFDIPGMPASGGSEAFYNAGHAAGGLLSGNWLESRGGTIFFGTARNRTLIHTDRTVTGTGSDGDLVDFVGRYLRAVSGRVYLDSGNLRFRKASDTVVELLDTAADSPARSMLRMWRLLLGPATATGLDQYNRNLLPKAWGVIEMHKDWIAGASAGDKGAYYNSAGEVVQNGVDGYYRSRTCRGNGESLVVQAYYLGDSGAAWVLTANPANAGERTAAIFKVSGLGLPDERYSVVARAVFDGTFSYAYAAKAPTTRLEVDVFTQTADAFFLSVTTVASDGTRAVLDPAAFLGVAKPEVRILFAVHAICDDSTFLNGGNG